MSTTLTTPTARAPRYLSPFRAAQEEMEKLWSQLTGDTAENGRLIRFNPTIDLTETPTTLELRMDAPGMKPENFDVQLSNGILTLSGERKQESEVSDKTYHRIERHYGSFSRSLALPAMVVEDKVDAKYRDGVLTVILHKTEESKSRKIQVKPA